MGLSLDTLLRLERGELAPDEAGMARRSLSNDPQAREWLAWIGALRRAAQTEEEPEGDDALAVDPIEIAALAEGALTEARAREVRSQLAASPRGYALLESALDALAEDMPAAGPTRVVSPSELRRIPRRALWGAGLAAAASVIVWAALARFGPGGAEPLAAFARIEPLPVADLRGQGDQLEAGLGHYRAGRWVEAAAAFEAALESDPDLGEAWLYLGSARLLQDRPRVAREALERAEETALGSFAAEARWQLAQVQLLLEDRDPAVALLDALAGGSSHRAEDAREQLLALERGRPADR